MGLGRWMNVKKLSKNRAHWPSGRKTMNKIQPKKFMKAIAKIGNSTWTLRMPLVAMHLTLSAVTTVSALTKSLEVHVLP